MARILRAAGLRVECHDHHFGEGTDDDDWLSHCGERGWIALSKDQRIRYSPLAKSRIMESGTRLFVLIGKQPHECLAINLVNTLEKVEQCIERNENGFIARVYMANAQKFGEAKPGDVREWLTRPEWARELSGGN